jgi:hypothetical protein
MGTKRAVIVPPWEMTEEQRKGEQSDAWARLAKAHDRMAERGVEVAYQRRCAEGARKRARA